MDPEQSPELVPTEKPKSGNSMFPQLEVLGEEYFVKKAPFQIPAETKELIVKYGPYIAAVLMLLSLPWILAIFGFTTLFSPFAIAAGYGFGYVTLLIGLVVFGLDALAIPGLMKRSKAGWNLLFYSTLLSLLIDLIHIDIASFLLTLLISGYILFQVRSYYK